MSTNMAMAKAASAARSKLEVGVISAGSTFEGTHSIGTLRFDVYEHYVNITSGSKYMGMFSKEEARVMYANEREAVAWQ